MKRIRHVLLYLGAIALSGCYSSARHVANVRPDLVKPYGCTNTKYRLGRIVLKKSPFSEMVAGGTAQLDRQESYLKANRARLQREFVASPEKFSSHYLSLNAKCSAFPHRKAAGYSAAYAVFYYNGQMGLQKWKKNPELGAQMLIDAELAMIKADKESYAKIVKEDRKSGPYGTHAANSKALSDSVRMSLLKHYPSVFTDDPSAPSLAVVVDWETEYKDLPNYASLLTYWLWPVGAEQTSTYSVFVCNDAPSVSDDAMWQRYKAAPKSDPRRGFAIRESEVWETGLLPLGLIPVPGESDWPKTFTFMRSGKGSLVGSPQDKLSSRECFEQLVFEPATDGDVLAAAIMRTLNRCKREAEVASMRKKGGKK